MILTRTPLRVSLFGGGTDYPAWFERNSGAVLGMLRRTRSGEVAAQRAAMAQHTNVHGQHGNDASMMASM